MLVMAMLTVAIAPAQASNRVSVQLWRHTEARRRWLWQQTGYIPWPEQGVAHLHPARVKLVAGGERAGKSRWTAEEMVTWCAWPKRSGGFWIVGPSYELARPEFLHLAPALLRLNLLESSAISMPLNGPCRMRTRLGVQIETRTSRDVETLAGQAPDGIAMVEAAQQTYESFLRLRGRVAETRGPLILSGTFEGSFGWYPELWKAWQADNMDGGRSFSIPSWANHTIYPLGRNDPEIRALEATFPADVFQERLGAKPCPPATLVFKEFSHITHVKPCPFNKKLPVQLWIDPGWAGAYAVLAVQLHGGAVFNIDEVYWTQRTAQEVIKECKEREWWKKVTHAWMDVAGRQHQGMESHVEIWRRLARIPVRSQSVGIPDGILRHRTFLKNPADRKPRIFYDPRCKQTIWEYGQYKYNEMKESRPVRELPIDRDCHALKAIAYGLVGNFGFVDVRRKRVRSMRYTMRGL